MDKKNQVLLTGDRPTGKLHLGHLVGSINNRINLQDKVDKAFYMIADVQALTDNSDNPDKVRGNVLEVALDNLACGLNPNKTNFFIQSEIPEIAELTIFFLNLVSVSRLKRNPTVKDEMNQKGYGEDVPAGFLMYPISQTADILFAKANIVPVGEDQIPVIEQANEIVLKFNSLYGETFEKIKAIPSLKLMGLDGKNKMSKSLNNAIFLSDDREILEAKVNKMYTDPNHIRIEDPGEVVGNVVFAYLDVFDKNKEKVQDLKDKYQKGGLGDTVLKKYLFEVLDEVLSPIRERREYLAKDTKEVMKILEEGTKKARITAKETIFEVKDKMKINYF